MGASTKLAHTDTCYGMSVNGSVCLHAHACANEFIDIVSRQHHGLLGTLSWVIHCRETGETATSDCDATPSNYSVWRVNPWANRALRPQSACTLKSVSINRLVRCVSFDCNSGGLCVRASGIA